VSKRKPRITITIVTEDGTIEFSHVKGRELADGKLSEGPTDQQIEIASRAIAKLMELELSESGSRR
jgi:hypothetical protein